MIYCNTVKLKFLSIIFYGYVIKRLKLFNKKIDDRAQ